MTRENQKNSIGITILGSTGTIGVNTLDVIARHPEQYHVVALTARNQVDRLLDQCKKFNPEFVVAWFQVGVGSKTSFANIIPILVKTFHLIGILIFFGRRIVQGRKCKGKNIIFIR